MDEVEGVLLDIDGVLYTGDYSVAGAVEAIKFLEDEGIPFRCLSNTTRRSRAAISARLGNFGLVIPEDLIFTPAAAIVSVLKDKGIDRCFFLTFGDVERDLISGGAVRSEESAGAVVIGDAGGNFSYSSLNTAFRLLMGGAEFFALEKDRYWMDNDGLSLSAGPFVFGLEYATGKTARLIGKPSPAFFEKALESMEVPAEKAVMVGDDIYTDIGGSQDAGLRGILVRTGKFDQKRTAESGISPCMIIDSIRDLPEVICGSIR